MEEQKSNVGKEIKMNPANASESNSNGGAAPKQEKLTYEQLNNVCIQLYQKNQELSNQIAQLNQFNMFKRLDYLFKVVEFGSMFNESFVDRCLKEIEAAMTIPEEKEEKKEG